jgi:hypothetical protein
MWCLCERLLQGGQAVRGGVLASSSCEWGAWGRVPVVSFCPVFVCIQLECASRRTRQMPSYRYCSAPIRLIQAIGISNAFASSSLRGGFCYGGRGSLVHWLQGQQEGGSHIEMRPKRGHAGVREGKGTVKWRLCGRMREGSVALWLPGSLVPWLPCLPGSPVPQIPTPLALHHN